MSDLLKSTDSDPNGATDTIDFLIGRKVGDKVAVNPPQGEIYYEITNMKSV